MISQILNKKTQTIHFAALILAVSSFFSLILGLIRNNLLSTSFAREQTDIFFVAFRIPDLVYGILITGGITAAFLPVFSSYFSKNKKQAFKLSSNVLCCFFIGLSGLSLILFIFAPFFIKYLVPGFTQAQQAITLQLMRIMFLSPILLGISAILSAILQYHNLFFAYALAPLFYNLGIILGILVFYPFFGMQGLAWGVVLGALLHLAVQIFPVRKTGFHLRLVCDLKFPGLRKIFKLAAPRAIGSGAYHISLIVITAIASTISSGAISIFYYSNYIYGVPISLIGISFATAVFPALSKNFIEKKRMEFLENFNTTFRHLSFFAIPSSFLFFVLRAQIVRLVYGASILQSNYFDWWATRLTSASVGILSFSLLTACLVPFLARVFFAFHDTKTPVKIAVGSMALNIASAYFFVWLLGFDNFFQRFLAVILKISFLENQGVIGLALSITLTSLFQAFLLLYFLKKKVSEIAGRSLLKIIFQFSSAAFLMAFCAWGSLRFYDFYFSTQSVVGIALQGLLAGTVGLIIYLAAVSILFPREIKNIRRLIAGMLKSKKPLPLREE